MLRAGQLEAICCTLLRRASAMHVWDAFSKCFLDDRVLEVELERMSSSEVTLVRVARAVWRRGNACELGDVVHGLDNANLMAVGSLLAALSGTAEDVEWWLGKHAAVERRPWLAPGEKAAPEILDEGILEAGKSINDAMAAAAESDAERAARDGLAIEEAAARRKAFHVVAIEGGLS